MGHAPTKHSSRTRRRPIGADASDLSHVQDRQPSEVRFLRFDSETFDSQTLSAAEVGPALNQDGIKWFDVAGPSRGDFEALRRGLGLDPVAVSIAAHPPQRPRYVIWHGFELLLLAGAAGAGGVQQVTLILGNGWVLSLQDHGGDLFRPVRERLRDGIGNLREESAAFLVSALVEALIDGLFEQAEDVLEEVEGLEDDILGDRQVHMPRLHRVRQHLLRLRRVVEPMREALLHLAHWRTPRWDHAARVHLREAGEDAQHLLGLVQYAQGTVASLGELYLSAMNARTNSFLTLLTLVSTLFLPMTFLTGLWGMNFEHMPELQWRWGYLVALATIALSGIGTLALLQRKGWLSPLRRLNPGAKPEARKRAQPTERKPRSG